jgi:carboxyl-terminal processing protease
MVAVAAWSIATPADGAAQQPFDHALAIETFDRAWKIINDTHFDTTFNGVDWPALREEIRPRVDTATGIATLRRAISDMLDRLGQSHFALIPQEAADALDPAKGDPSAEVGDVGFDMRFIGDQLVVTRVDADGPAAQAGVRPGWVILSVGDDRVEDLVERLRNVESRRPLDILVWSAVQRRLQGTPASTCEVEFLDGRDQVLHTEITRQPEPGAPVKLGNLPTFFARFSAERTQAPDGVTTVGVVWFNAWMVPLMRQLDEAIDEYRRADGIVIDLRGNTGGVGSMPMGVGGHFLDERVSLGTMKTRTTDLKFVTNPRRVSTAGERVVPFAGPVAILTDDLSASASEMFAGGMQAVGRVRVFGDTTMGAVLPASMDRLPNGDVLYHAFGEFETSSGVYLEGRGVYPDEPVALTREALLAGRDEVLLAALRWIAEEKRGTPQNDHDLDEAQGGSR